MAPIGWSEFVYLGMGLGLGLGSSLIWRRQHKAIWTNSPGIVSRAVGGRRRIVTHKNIGFTRHNLQHRAPRTNRRVLRRDLEPVIAAVGVGPLKKYRAVGRQARIPVE